MAIKSKTVKFVPQASILLGAIALTTLMPGISLAKPQMSASPAPTAAPAHSPRILDQLNLTKEQKTKIRSIRASRTRQINDALKPEQQTKLQAELKSGKKLSEALKTLNLNADEKKKILGVIRKSNEEIMAALNPAQRKQLETYLRERHQANSQTAVD